MTLRATKGSKLTHAEVDANFQELEDANTASNTDILTNTVDITNIETAAGLLATTVGVNTTDIGDHESRVTTLEAAGAASGGPSTFAQLSNVSIGEGDYNYELFPFTYTDGQELSIRYNIISKEVSGDAKETFNGLFVIPGSLLVLATDANPVNTQVFLENGLGQDENPILKNNSGNFMWKIKKVDDGTAIMYLNSTQSNRELLVIYDILETSLATPYVLQYAQGG